MITFTQRQRQRPDLHSDSNQIYTVTTIIYTQQQQLYLHSDSDHTYTATATISIQQQRPHLHSHNNHIYTATTGNEWACLGLVVLVRPGQGVTPWDPGKLIPDP